MIGPDNRQGFWPMAPSALDTSAAHPLYLYVVFVVCVLAAVALLVGASLSRRSSSWRRQMQVSATTAPRPGPAYPIEPAQPAVEAASVVPKKTAARKTSTAIKKAPAAKKTTPRKTTAKKAATRADQ